MASTATERDSAFPNQTFNSSNYWVDVVFETGPAPTLNSIAVAPVNPEHQQRSHAAVYRYWKLIRTAARRTSQARCLDFFEHVGGDNQWF